MALSKITNSGVAPSGLPTGAVIQTVTNSTEGGFIGQTNTTLADVTNFTVSITPSSTSSKIFIVVSAYVTNALVNSTNVSVQLSLLRGSTQLSVVVCSAQSGSGGLQIRDSAAFTYLDSPATTSATTYKIQGLTDSASSAYGVDEGRIVVMEIAG